MNDQVILTTTTKDALIQEFALLARDMFSDLLKQNQKETLQLKEWLNGKETCELLKISNVTLWTYVKDGRIKAHKIGNNVRYNRHEVEKALIQKTAKKSYQ
jgi:excisionase family DNA binding protein